MGNTHYGEGMTPTESLKALNSLVQQQALDEGLWFKAHTICEAYLQTELRRLHASIEAAYAKVKHT